MEDALKALLIRSMTFVEIALALTQQEGQLLRAQIAAELQKKPDEPAKE